MTLLSIRRCQTMMLWLAAAAALCSCNHGADNKLGHTTTVRRGRFEINIVEEGRLKALHSTTITAKESGKIEWLAPEGDIVDKGAILVRMETKELEEQLERFRNDLKDSESELEELQESYAKEKEDIEDEISGLTLALELAKLQLDMVLKCPLPADKAKAQADLKRKEILLKDAEAEQKRQEELWAAKAISENELRRAAMLAKVARANYERQKLSYSQLCAGATPLQVEKAKLDVEMAQLNYEVAKERIHSQIARLEEDIARAQARVERNQSLCRRTQTHIDNRTLYAPHRGLVIYYQQPRWRAGGDKRKVEVGASVYTGGAIIELPDLERMKVRTQVSESNIRHIRIGKPAAIQVDIPQLAGFTLHGKVCWIDKVGRDRNSRLDYSDRRREGLAGINVFDIEVAIDEADARLKLNAKAKVKLPIQVFDDVIFVPKKAIRVKQGRPTVWVVVGDKVDVREVELGEENETDVIVNNGLKAGDTVALR